MVEIAIWIGRKSLGKSRGLYSCVNLESVWRRKLENAGPNEQLIHRRSVCDNPAEEHYVASELRLVNAAIMSAFLYDKVRREYDSKSERILLQWDCVCHVIIKDLEFQSTHEVAIAASTPAVCS